MLVNKQLPALYNGVSQQPATLRLPSQAEAQVNGHSTVVDGLNKRPPTEHLARISTSDLSGALIHTINRDVNERYVLVLSDRSLKVFDLDGNEKTVAMPGRTAWAASTAYSTVSATRSPTVPNGFLYRVHTAGTSGLTQPTWPTTLGATVVDGTVTWQCVPDYLKVTDAKQDFVCVTVADYTFIVNKTVYCAMSAIGADEKVVDASAWTVTTKKVKGLAALIQASVLAAQRKQYAANPGGTFKGTKQTLQDIPDSPAPVDGDIWEIQGTGETGFATYYVRRNGGVWDETVEPNIANRILESTMPHALVRLADGTFEFNVFSWAPRRVGNEDTNPNPAFIGRTIRDVFFYQNRLGFAVDEGVAMSRVGDFGNFYRLTVLDLLDDATVSINASETKVTLIDSAVPFNNGMMLFSGQVQFRLNHGDGPLTPSSASLDVATQFRMSPGVRPVPIGGDVYFPTDDGNWTAVREYFVRDDANSNDAGNVAAHVPKFIPAGVFKMAGSDTHDMVMILSSAQPRRVYTYKFYWTGSDDKAQSAWSYWEFAPDATVLSVDFLDNHAYFVVKRPDGAYLERMSLESGAVAPGLSFQIYLDRRASVTGTYLPVEGKTEFTLPYPVDASARSLFRIVRGSAFSTASGAILAVDPASYQWVSSTVVKVAGNFAAGPCLVGMNYEFRYTFSEQFIRNAQDVPVVSGRLQMRTWTVYFVETAYFKTEVAPYGADAEVEEVIPAKIANFDGKTLGAASLALGTPTFDTGAYSFQVYGDATVATVSLINDTPYRSTFQQAEWEGFYHNRSRTI